MLQVVQSTNLALRFALELAALASLSYWGFHVVASTSWRTGAGDCHTSRGGRRVGAVRFPAGQPGFLRYGQGGRAARRLRLAAVALVQSRKSGLAALFAGVAVANTALMIVWQQ